MNIMSVLLFLSSVASLAMAIYVIVSMLQTKQMHKKNKKMSEYLKDKSFLVMKNKGKDLESEHTEITMFPISQEGSYLIRRQ